MKIGQDTAIDIGTKDMFTFTLRNGGYWDLPVTWKDAGSYRKTG